MELFHLPFSTFPFTIFLLFFSIFTPFPFFLASFFPVGQQKFPGLKSLGTLGIPSFLPIKQSYFFRGFCTKLSFFWGGKKGFTRLLYHCNPISMISSNGGGKFLMKNVAKSKIFWNPLSSIGGGHLISGIAHCIVIT